ncbi:MAG: filamentous hemagglutinin N-terminal domain-containing protein, partial [Polaromonas sp.]|nr:filamentous hemagglutinin N-terminal domain-containing protein [Polaromonas sp.]
MTAPSPFPTSSRPWTVRTVVVRLSRKLTATYRIRSGRLLSRLLAAMLAGFVNLSLALPTGVEVVAGQASVTTPAPNSMLIRQGTDKAILNWQSFGIGTGQSVQFVQPGAASVALNRVTGGNPSAIYGSLSANGQVFLINPAGVMFAPGAQVNVGGLVASTLGISNDDFIAGRYTFSGNSDAGVLNQGRITTARGGYVLLAGAQVTNSGAITTESGSTGLLAGSRVTLDTSGVGLVRFSVDAAAVNAAASNSGTITAAGGQVAMLASSLGDAMATVVNQTGVIRATSATERNGLIVLSGGTTGAVRVSGTLDASGAAAGQTGGTVQVLGDRVELATGALLDASGHAGGGVVLVGGDYQGNNSAVQNATRTHVAAGTSIRADAIQSGNGGKVVVWADGDTRQLGSISARGGEAGGNGGFVEVSGKKLLDFHGRIDVSAPQGVGGKVLFDPENIVLDASVQASPPNNAAGAPDVAFADAPNPGTYTIQVSDVVGYNELFLQATNDITLASALTMGAGNSVRFEANNNININGALTVSGAGAINLKADADNSGTGALAIGAALSSQAGGITLSGAGVSSTAAGTISTTGAGNANAGQLTIASTGAVNLAGTITATGGAAGAGLVGRAGGAVNISGVGGVTTADISASGTTGGTGNTAGGSAGSITVNNTGTGDVSLGALMARAGAARGTGASSAVAGSINVTNSATGANLSTLAIDTSGGAGGNGGLVGLSSQG